MDIYEIIKVLCKNNRISIAELEKKLGLTRNTLYKWKTQSPSIERLVLVANYFNVSVDFLVGRSSNSSFDDISYLDMLEQEAEANLMAVIDLLQSYFTVEYTTSDLEPLIIIEEMNKIDGFKGSINEFDLKNNATALMRKISDKEYDFDDIYKKSILLTLFNKYSSEENFVKELLTYHFSAAKVLSTIVHNFTHEHSKLFLLNDFAIEITLQPLVENDDAYITLPIKVSLSIDGEVEYFFYNLDVQIDGQGGITVVTFPPTIIHPHFQIIILMSMQGFSGRIFRVQ